MSLFDDAKRYIAGGVNSPVRAFNAVGGIPLFVKKGMGSKILCEDNREYIDYCMSWGPLILGHAPPKVISKVKKALENGTSFGTPTKKETELCRLIADAFPSIGKLRLVNSGTEGVMSALRLARGFTDKNKVIKFEGCYHGHVDSLLVKAGSGLSNFAKPTSAGIDTSIVKNTLVAEYNSIGSVKKIINEKKNRGKIGAVIIEPIAGNMGVVLPKPGFLEELREITSKSNILLIFDEVITGFRVGYNGAQGLYRVKPDITVLGKIIGGGFPIGAFGGKGEIMDLLAPDGEVYQAGTLSGNPVATTAGIETLKILENKQIYNMLERNTCYLVDSISSKLNKGILSGKNLKDKIKISHIASMFTIFFNKGSRIENYKTAKQSNASLFARFHRALLSNNIYFPPSQFEACFLSASHSAEDLDFTINAAGNALDNMII